MMKGFDRGCDLESRMLMMTRDTVLFSGMKRAVSRYRTEWEADLKGTVWLESM